MILDELFSGDQEDQDISGASDDSDRDEDYNYEKDKRSQVNSSSEDDFLVKVDDPLVDPLADPLVDPLADGTDVYSDPVPGPSNDPVPGPSKVGVRARRWKESKKKEVSFRKKRKVDKLVVSKKLFPVKKKKTTVEVAMDPPENNVSSGEGMDDDFDEHSPEEPSYNVGEEDQGTSSENSPVGEVIYIYILLFIFIFIGSVRNCAEAGVWYGH